MQCRHRIGRKQDRVAIGLGARNFRGADRA
jgi:hypothetical protein